MIKYQDIKPKKPPLPFMGNKSPWLREFYNVLSRSSLEGDGIEFYDIFGGSGLLSNTLKQMYPGARVVYNDYDGYIERLKRLPQINEIVTRIHEEAGLDKIPKKAKITGEAEEKVKHIIENIKDPIIKTQVERLFSFSGQAVKRREQAIFKRFKSPCRPLMPDYLKGVEVVKKDYTELMKPPQGSKKVIWVLDPPYTYSYDSTYAGGLDFKETWEMVKTLFKHLKSGAVDGYILFDAADSPVSTLMCELFASRGFRPQTVTKQTLKLGGNKGYEQMAWGGKIWQH